MPLAHNMILHNTIESLFKQYFFVSFRTLKEHRFRNIQLSVVVLRLSDGVIEFDDN
jgi:hypothetical protein